MKPRELARLLDQQATVRRGGALDRSGNPTDTTTFTIPCRVERRQRRVVTHLVSSTGRYGEEVLSDTTMVTNMEVRPTDEVRLPDETKWRGVMNVERAGSPDRRGADVWQVML